MKKRFWIWLVFVFVLVLVGYLTWDYRGPAEIQLHRDNAFGLVCLRAPDLLVQQYDSEGNLWATRGMLVYKLRNGENKFIRQYHIPTGFSLFWLRNFPLVRRLTHRPECMEILPTAEGEICAMSAGRMWYKSSDGKDFVETLILPHYDIGKGQGVRNAGLVRLKDGTILVGEYFLNRERTAVHIFGSKDSGRTWNVMHNFAPGEIRHVHAVQQDPFTDKVWVCTGDRNNESMIAWSGDSGKIFNPIGHGSQLWRVCQLVFTKEAIFWGTDTSDNTVSGIYRWDRKACRVTKLGGISVPVFYATRLTEGTIVLSSVCNKGTKKGCRTQLFVVSQRGEVKVMSGGTWKYKGKMAKLRFQRDQGGPSLCITCLDQKEFRDGDLIIITEQTLKEAVAYVPK